MSCLCPGGKLGEDDPLVHRASVDALLAQTGGFGRFQWRVVLAFMVVQAFCACTVMTPTYVVLKVTTQWDLSQYADPSSLMAGFFFGGQAIGFPLWGMVLDRTGRVNGLLLSCTLIIVSTLLSLAATGLWGYCVLRGIVGLCTGAAWIGQQQLAVEYVAPKYRTPCFVLQQVGWWLGETYAVWMADAVSGVAQWRVLALLLLPGLLVPCVLRGFPESPRYLLQRGQHAEAVAVLRRIGNDNRAPLGASVFLEDPVGSVGGPTTWQDTLGQLRHPDVLSRLLLVCFVWFGAAGSYYALAFSHLDLGVSNEYVSAFILIAAEFPTFFIFWALADVGGRRFTLCVFFALSSAAIIVLAVTAAPLHPNPRRLPPPLLAYIHARAPSLCPYPQFSNGHDHTTTLVFGISGRLAATLTAATIWLAASEWFPTSVRGVVLGIGAAAGRIGCIVLPLCVNSNSRSGPITIGVFLAACGLATLFLTEMGGAPLPDGVVSAPLGTKPAGGKGKEAALTSVTSV